MESKTVVTDYQPSTRGRMLAAAGPLLWIAVSYVDPGKWAAAVDGGARFGFDLALLVLIINCAAILCHYLSARIAIATGKDLAQICSEEYDDVMCVLLGIEAEVSMIALDLTMVLGTAYGLNVIVGIDLFNCVFLTGFDAVVFPILANFLGNPKAKFLSICLASFILVSYFCGVLLSQPESSLTMGGMLNKLSGENAYALMSLLGANIMPHNFYLHSSIVQQDQVQTNVSKVALCHDHFVATVCIFSGIFLANCMLMNLAANVFYSSGLVSLTLQDAVSLLEQVFRSSIASISLLVVMFFSNQLIALPWSLGRQVVAQDLFRLEIPGWLHRATIRIIAIIPALYCVWNSGTEGIFQVLVFTQVVIALLLPSSVIPLFRVASSRSIMGPYKVSRLVEFLALVSFVGMLGLKIVFVIEMIFGSSEWVSSLKWNIGNAVPIPYLTLLMAALASLCLMLLLATTPLKSASPGTNIRAMKQEEKPEMPGSAIERVGTEVSEVPYRLEKAMEQQEPELSLQKSIRNRENISIMSPDLSLPETLADSESNLCLTMIHENKSEITFFKPAIGNLEAAGMLSEGTLAGIEEVSTSELLNASTLCVEAKDMVEKTLEIEGHVKNEKDVWEAEELTKDVCESSQSLTSEGSGSFRSLSCKIDSVGSGGGSLSRLAGLGRAARRQLTAVLDEFWGQLFDFHGQATHEAKAKKLDVVLGVDSKVDSKSSFSSAKLEGASKQSTGYIPSTGGRGSDSSRVSSFCNPLKQHYGQSNIGPPLGMQQRSSIYSNHMQLLDAYVRSSSHNMLDSGERRYNSVHVPSSSDGYDQQPATFHGYDLKSYLGRMVKEEGSDCLKDQLESQMQNSTPSIKSESMYSYGRPLGQKPHSGSRTLTPPGFHNVPVSRNNSLKSERPFQNLYTPEPVGLTNNPPNAKKFYSLPDISGLHIPQRDSSLIYGQSINHPACKQPCLNASTLAGSALGFNGLSPSEVRRDAFPLHFNSSLLAGSLWSKQPYEQFGVADKSPSVQEAASIMDIEAKLLQSFRSCIIKLLKLEGSDWLFGQNDGADEDIIDRVAAREKILYEVEARALDTKMQMDEADQSNFMPVPNCGEGCVWRVDLIISFGVWCIHRILDLSLMESRPELWGKYTYVLNRLQGIIDLAFSKPRSPMAPCFCLQLTVGEQPKPSPPISNGSLPPHSKPGRGKFTTAAMLLDIIKDVESAISCRKGRTGTAAGDVAFPKGKENLASVLKRYKRRLSNKPVGSQEIIGHGPRKIAV
ncbi:Ethylene-insensitive protein 2 [Sesamum alatum]|uniref:Ethylene-insensitive protein 2 n=1 Tax=Sesamum alatum TaxID=300844 RepID=A0AAE1YMA0_9LAMI|nr:Ethylene-insensitive protein 2 [Sesamum alatum]